MEKEDSQEILKYFGEIEEFKPVNKYTEQEVNEIAELLYQVDELSQDNDNQEQ